VRRCENGPVTLTTTVEIVTKASSGGRFGSTWWQVRRFCQRSAVYPTSRHAAGYAKIDVVGSLGAKLPSVWRAS